MDSYRIFENEEEYVKTKENAMRRQQDKLMRRWAIRIMKEIYGSSLRKLLEVTGWHSGQFLDADVIQRMFDKYQLHEETYRFLICLIEAFNDGEEYMNRKTPMRRWKKLRVRKKHFNAYLLSGMRELKSYQSLFTSTEEKECFRAMRRALLVYNKILETFFARRPLKHIPLKLYEKCVNIDSDFSQFYEKGETRAELTLMGRCCKASKRGGMKHSFSDDVIWQFVLYILRLER